jgi:hypothetical protein
MDEYNGVLRVISQWDDWSSGHLPTLETFQVASSSDIKPLAKLDIQLPRPETLQSVRFDEDRAYAITVERTDPLLTFDLSSPAQPRQVGQLEIPGWVYHMEPRGNRVYAIGFDQANQEGGLHVSLFDVADLAHPKMLSRVNFGGKWGSFAEDQDRIQKSFRLLDAEGFAVVPFSGYSQGDVNGCGGQYSSGIQLVDYTRDTLKKRGVAPQLGEARRALVHRNTLLGIGDDAVQSFDITDRDSVKKIDTIETARNTSSVRVVGNKLLRFGADWWTDRAVLDVTSLNDADSAESGTELDLSAYIDEDASCNGNGVWSSGNWGNVYVQGSYAYVERSSYRYDNSVSSSRLQFLVVDLGGDKPRVVGKFGPSDVTTDYNNREYNSFAGVVQTGHALLIGKRKQTYQDDGATKTEQAYEVFDLRTPQAPVSRGSLAVPDSLVQWGWGWFTPMCGCDLGWGWGGYRYNAAATVLVSGDVIASSHSEPLAKDATVAKYFLDRIDFSDPAHPVILEPVNIPGRAVDYRANTGRVLSMEETIEKLPLSSEDCYAAAQGDPSVRTYYSGSGTVECQRFTRRMNLVDVYDNGAKRLKSVSLDQGAWRLGFSAISAERVFAKQQTYRVETTTYPGGSYSYAVVDTERSVAFDSELNQVWTSAEAKSTGWSTFRARDSRAFEDSEGRLTVYDTTDIANPKQREFDLLGYGCDDLEVRGKTAVCSHGKQGIEVFTLD